VLSRLPAADVDFYGFEATEAQRIEIACESESGGSGVRGLVGEVLDPERRSLVQARETSTANLLIQGLRTPRSGKHVLKLTGKTPAAGDMPNAVDPWVRCVIIVGG
jgi:hypothetical protein